MARRELLINLDGSIPEHYQYVKLAWVVLMVLLLARAWGSWWFLPWAAAFLYMVVDDFFAVHEHVGWWIDQQVEPSHVIGLPLRDVAELALPAVVGIVLAPLLLWSLVGSSGAVRAVLRRLAGLLVLFAVFAVGVDLLHAALPDPGELWKAWGVLEEGGEMVVVSVIVAFVFGVLVLPARRETEAARHEDTRSEGPAVECVGQTRDERGAVQPVPGDPGR